MKTLILAFLISFSLFAADPGGGGGGGPLTKVDNLIIINGELHVPISVFNQYNIYSQLLQNWQLDKIRIVSAETIAIKNVAEVEYINSDFVLPKEVEQETIVPTYFVRTLHLVNGDQIEMVSPAFVYENITPSSGIIKTAQDQLLHQYNSSY